MRDHGAPAHSDTSQRPVSPDNVFKPHRYQPCFLRVSITVRVRVSVRVRVRRGGFIPTTAHFIFYSSVG